MKGSGRSLIGGPGADGNPVEKRGPWVDANLRVVTLQCSDPGLEDDGFS